jgi:hypothetical protein
MRSFNILRKDIMRTADFAENAQLKEQDDG